jgi:hypothetical protein
MGLGRKDDSQVVKVYESISGVPVAKSPKVQGDEVGMMMELKRRYLKLGTNRDM